MIDVIEKLERTLAQAMLRSDVATLDQLLHDDLVFTNHSGAVLSKADDLALHRSGLRRLDRLTPEQQALRIVGNVATVVVHVELEGSYDGAAFAGRFAYTRVWLLDRQGGQIIAAHSAAL